jgi:hypothetical protein
MFRRITLFIAFNVLAASALFAQTRAATISGTVKDTSGAIIPGATITIRNTDTGVAKTLPTTGEGTFTVPNLIPGNYLVAVESPGMKRMERSGLVLQVGDHIALDLVLQVGNQTQLVTVTGETPMLRTADAEAGLVIDQRRIEELPEYDRNPLAFAKLTPNVNGTSEEMGQYSDFRINGGRTGEAEYYIDGTPVTTGYLHNVTSGIPGMEAVEEFKVITNGMSAEYGRLSGGAVALVTRSGTNDLHGSAYEFFQNQVLNASDWNSNRYNEKKGAFHNNIYGFAVGGPVWIPKLYNGRNKTFFFLNYEGTSYSAGSNAVTAGVPTDLEKQGDFSQSLNYPGNAIVTVSDPTTGFLAPPGYMLNGVDVGGDVIRIPFPGDKLQRCTGTMCTSAIDPYSAKVLATLPEPNHAPLAGTNHGGNWIGSQTGTSSLALWTGRFDENWNAKNTTHFSWIESDSSNGQSRLYNMAPVSVSTNGGKTISLEHDYTINPTTVLTLRGGVVRQVTTSGSSVIADSTNWGYSPQMLDILGTTHNRVTTMISNFDTISNFGGGSVGNDYETDYNILASVQKVWGKQTIKIGFDHRRYYSNVPSGGNLTEQSSSGVDAEDWSYPEATGSGLAGFELGYTVAGNGTSLGGPASLQTYWGSYIQDDIKLTPKFTLNAGIRWDWEPPRTERYNRQVWWDRNYHWPVVPAPGWSWSEVTADAAAVTPSPGATASAANAPMPNWLTNGYELGRVAELGTPDYPGRISQADLWHHFAPRVGFAWQLLPKTVLRGGYGINWLTTTSGWDLNATPWNIGYGDSGLSLQGGTADGGLTFPNTMENLFAGGGFVPNPYVTRSESALNNSLDGSWFISNPYAVEPGFEHTVQLSLQREVGSGSNSWVFEGSFAGNFGRKLYNYLGNGEHILPDAYHKLFPYGYNTLYAEVPNPIFGQGINPNTFTGPANVWFGRMYSQDPYWMEIWTMGDGLGTSNYYAGYFQVQHRFGRGFSALINYTVSKMLQDDGGTTGQFGPGNGNDTYPQGGMPWMSIYGVAPTDIPQKLTVNYSWDLPMGRGRKLLSAPSGLGGAVLNDIVGGWRVAGTTTAYSGEVLGPYQSGSSVGFPGSNWYSLGLGRTDTPSFTGVEPLGFTKNGHAALQGSANMQLMINPPAFAEPTGMNVGTAPGLFPNWRGPGFSQWDFAVMKNFPLGSEKRTLQLRFESQNLFNHMNAGMPDQVIGDPYEGEITGQNGNPRRIMVAGKILF